jgi:hypothetical protein
MTTLPVTTSYMSLCDFFKSVTDSTKFNDSLYNSLPIHSFVVQDLKYFEDHESNKIYIAYFTKYVQLTYMTLINKDDTDELDYIFYNDNCSVDYIRIDQATMETLIMCNCVFYENIVVPSMIISDHVLLQNPHTIAHMTGTYIPKKHVMPYRLCMVSFAKCDYSGLPTSTGHAVSVPYMYLFGVICSDEHHIDACNDILDYCEKNEMYPINEQVLNTANVNRNITIKRTHGILESDWKIMTEESTIALTYKNDEGVDVKDIAIMCCNDVIGKRICLSKLCELNEFIDYDKFVDAMKTERDDWFFKLLTK